VFREIQVADLFAGMNNPVERLENDRTSHFLPVDVSHFNVVYFNQIRVFSSGLLITCGVDLGLEARHLLRLGILSGLRVDDRDLIGVSPSDQINSAAPL